jgi:hypothetical protein
MTEEDNVDGDKLTCICCDSFVDSIDEDGLCDNCKNDEEEEE